MLKGVLTVGGWTMASRVLGFARDMLIAARLGAGPMADAFFVALKLPNLFRRLFGEGAFNAAFIPAFAGTLATQGPRAARDLAERMLALMSVWLSSLVLLGILVMPQILALAAPGFAAVPAGAAPASLAIACFEVGGNAAMRCAGSAAAVLTAGLAGFLVATCWSGAAFIGTAWAVRTDTDAPFTGAAARRDGVIGAGASLDRPCAG